jgi:hypothetical protein
MRREVWAVAVGLPAPHALLFLILGLPPQQIPHAVAHCGFHHCARLRSHALQDQWSAGLESTFLCLALDRGAWPALGSGIVDMSTYLSASGRYQTPKEAQRYQQFLQTVNLQGNGYTSGCQTNRSSIATSFDRHAASRETRKDPNDTQRLSE